MGMTQGRVFRLAQKDQRDSKLVQLPAELRLRILRLLLRHDRRIPTRNAYFTFGVSNDYKCGEFSSQILGTCQDLFHDAYYVLYHENMASVRVFGARRTARKLQLEVLNAVACFVDLVPGSNENYFIDCKKEPYSQRRYMDIGAVVLEDALKTLAHFSKVHITFEDSKHYMVISRCLRKFILGKRLVVDLGQHVDYHRSINPFELYIEPFWPFFSPACFGVWKCKSIEFQNGDRNKYYIESYADLTNLITNSHIRVRDLLPDMWRVNDVLSLLSGIQCRSAMSDHLLDGIRHNLLHALYNNDVLVFKQATRQLMEQAENILSEIRNSQKRAIEISASVDLSLLDQEFPEGFKGDDDTWRTLWSDHIIGQQEDRIKTLEKEISDTWRLMTELLDEDDLMREACIEDVKTHTPPSATADGKNGSFICWCGSCWIVNGRLSGELPKHLPTMY